MEGTLLLTIRSRAAMYAGAFVALSAFFLFFAALDYRAHRSVDTMMEIAAVFLLFGIMLLLFARHHARRQATLLRSGQDGQAIITAVRNVTFFRSGPGYIELKYRYEPSPGQAFETRSRLLTVEEGGDLRIGQRGNIKFDAQRPARSAWTGPPTDSPKDPLAPERFPSLFAIAKRTPALWVLSPLAALIVFAGLIAVSQTRTADIDRLIVCGGVVLGGVCLFALALRKLLVWRTVLKDGVPAQGVVIDVTVPFLVTGAISEWRRVIRYSYTDDHGQHHRGESGYLSLPEATRWLKGDKCALQIGRSSPQRSIWIGRI